MSCAALQAATFTDDNWSSIGNIDKVVTLPSQAGGVRAVAEGDSVTRTFTITNRADAPMIINSVRMGDSGMFEVDRSGMLTNVPAGGSTTFTVTFYPWDPGEHTNQLLVSTSASPECFGFTLGDFQIIVTGIGLW